MSYSSFHPLAQGALSRFILSISCLFPIIVGCSEESTYVPPRYLTPSVGVLDLSSTQPQAVGIAATREGLVFGEAEFAIDPNGQSGSFVVFAPIFPDQFAETNTTFWLDTLNPQLEVIESRLLPALAPIELSQNNHYLLRVAIRAKTQECRHETGCLNSAIFFTLFRSHSGSSATQPPIEARPTPVVIPHVSPLPTAEPCADLNQSLLEGSSPLIRAKVSLIAYIAKGQGCQITHSWTIAQNLLAGQSSICQLPSVSADLDSNFKQLLKLTSSVNQMSSNLFWLTATTPEGSRRLQAALQSGDAIEVTTDGDRCRSNPKIESLSSILIFRGEPLRQCSGGQREVDEVVDRAIENVNQHPLLVRYAYDRDHPVLTVEFDTQLFANASLLSVNVYNRRTMSWILDAWEVPETLATKRARLKIEHKDTLRQILPFINDLKFVFVQGSPSEVGSNCETAHMLSLSRGFTNPVFIQFFEDLTQIGKDPRTIREEDLKF